MPTPGGTWLHLKRWCGHLTGSALFDSFCYKFVLYPTYCNTLLCEWIIKETRKHLKVIAVRGGTSLLKKTGRISRSVKVLLYAPWRKHQVRSICDGIVSMDLVTEGWMSRHTPIELSSTLRFFVKHGGKISVKSESEKLSSKQFGTRWPWSSLLLCLVRFPPRKDNSWKDWDKRWGDPRFSNQSEHHKTRKKASQ